MLGDEQSGATVPRMILGARLRRLREARNIARSEAGETIRGSRSKISRLEAGRTGFKLRDVEDLLTLYGVTEEGDRATLLALARRTNSLGWWQSYHDVVPSWLHVYLGLEQAAEVIRCYELQYIPGLLQTEEYARAVLRQGSEAGSRDQTERRVELRMRRCRVLQRATPPRLWAVIDEAALHRAVAGATAMRAQLTHLLEMSELPHVTLQVMPFAVGEHAALGGPVTLLRPPGDELPDVVFLEHPTGALFPDKPAEVERYRHIMNSVVVDAASAHASREMLHRIRAQL
ncbi:DUF5753 domain-containing protein [Streptomyces sp. ACA25]|nr:DUF5753 domain-containing protein [Streptomyces sp. ACA25]MDB1089198.1 DUF5753 domain-containing protein [Streptomyces sp. ACA25]